MKKLVLSVFIFGLVGCARPYGPADQVLNKDVVSPKSGEQ